MDTEYDVITRRFKELGFTNAKGSRVKVYFIPSYLNGTDGVFNMKYYDLLVGLDLTLFPSYYEPWGYTPLESLAFSIPSLTTSLAGFGLWVRSHYGKEHPGITILDRNDSNYYDVVDGVVARVKEIAALDSEGRKAYMASAKDVSTIALWENQIQYYKEAYSKAIEKVIEAKGAFPDELNEDKSMVYKKIVINNPTWKSVMVTRHLPDALSGLETLSKNLWWCWNESAKSLFKSIDPVIWHDTCHNPMALLDAVSLKRFKALAKDDAFLGELKSVMDEFNAYMALKAERKDPSIAYFCMEYGLDTSQGDQRHERQPRGCRTSVPLRLLHPDHHRSGRAGSPLRRPGLHEDPGRAGDGRRGQLDDHKRGLPWARDHRPSLEGGRGPYRPLSA